MTDLGWKWKVGYLHGFGEALWQELFGNIRRITRFIVLPNGQGGFAKSIPCMFSTETEPQFPVEGFVIASNDADPNLAADANRAWEPSGIVPVNGASRLKLQ